VIRLQGSQQFLGEFFDNALVVAEIKKPLLESIGQFGLAFLYSLVAAKRFQALVALYAYCLTDNCLK
jgi:hypothetical protein